MQLGNEWISFMFMYDPEISKCNRATIIYLKYLTFFYISEMFSLVTTNFHFFLISYVIFCFEQSPLYFVLVCLIAGLAERVLLNFVLRLTAKMVNIGNSICFFMMVLGAVGMVYFWFIPRIDALKYTFDKKWSFIYVITFGIDFLIFQ